MKKKIVCFDIDNVICLTKNNAYRNSVPIKKNIYYVNKLYNRFYIKLFTARYMGRNDDNIEKAYAQGYSFTVKQLKKWKVKYHELIMGKPSFDIVIDDKSVHYKKNWYKLILKKL